MRDAAGTWIGLHPHDAVLLESQFGHTDALLEAMFHFLFGSGVPDGKLPNSAFASMVPNSMVTKSMVTKSMVTMAESAILFDDEKEIDLPGWSLRTIWTPGH